MQRDQSLVTSAIADGSTFLFPEGGLLLKASALHQAGTYTNKAGQLMDCAVVEFADGNVLMLTTVLDRMIVLTPSETKFADVTSSLLNGLSKELAVMGRSLRLQGPRTLAIMVACLGMAQSALKGATEPPAAPFNAPPAA